MLSVRWGSCHSVSEWISISLPIFKVKMRFFVNLLCLSIVIVVGNAQYYPYYRGDLYPYPNYPNYHSDDINMMQFPDDQEKRIFFTQFLNAITSFYTSTTTTTSTSTTTCTISTKTSCRRKRFLVDDLEAESIEPSVVNKVEVTSLDPGMETAVRNERKADPQFGIWRVDTNPHEIQSTFGQSPYYPINYNPYINRQVIAADPRFFIVQVITSTSTTTSTFTSTPACSKSSNFNQC